MPPTPARFRARACLREVRALAALLVAVAAANLVLLAILFALDLVAPADHERLGAYLLVRRLLYFSIAPAAVALAAWLLNGATLVIDARDLTVERRGTSWVVPRASIVDVVPWRVPWPAPGVTLVLASGRRFRYGLAPAGRDPTALVAALGFPVDAPALRDARARRAARFLRHPVLKHGVAPLVPTFILFRVHEIITTGELLGEYHWYGLGRWLYALSGVYIYTAGHLFVLAAGLRVVVELVAWPCARLGDRPARAVRLTVEALAMLAFYGSVTWGLWTRLGD